MKIPFIRCSLFFAALTLTMMSSILIAQEGDPFSENYKPVEGRRMDLDFSNPRASEVSDALGKLSEKPISIIFVDNSQQLILPSMNLKNVSFNEFLLLLNELGQRDEGIGGTGFGLSEVPDLEGIYTFELLNSNGKRRTPDGTYVAEKPESLFVDLSSILSETMTIHDVTTAIHTAWGGNGKEDVSEALKFHQETQLLVINAPEGRLKTADHLMNLLKNRQIAERSDKKLMAIEHLERKIQREREDKKRLSREMVEMGQAAKKREANLKEKILELEIKLAKLESKLKKKF